MPNQLGLKIYRQESNNSTLPLDVIAKASDAWTDLLWPLIGNLLVFYNNDPIIDKLFASRLDIDPEAVSDGIIEGLTLWIKLSHDPTAWGFDTTTYFGASTATALSTKEFIIVDLTSSSIDVDPVQLKLYTTIFSMEFGWVLKRYMMLGPTNILDENLEPEKRRLPQDDKTINQIVISAVQEFRELHIHANSLLSSMVRGQSSLRELMLHYTCIMGRLMSDQLDEK
ncbi:MAG: hypothetical protein HQL54_01115 [Magnetococcales bacterium]|nr:hypothetical protein [Magnetococcales bacterium]